MVMSAVLSWTFALMLAGPLPPPAPPTAAAGGGRPSLLLVIGAAGAPEYDGRFREAAGRWQKAAARAGAKTTVIGLESTAGSSDRQDLQIALREASRERQAPLWLVFIGHGTFDGRNARFNLRGTDVSASELGEWLKGLSRPLVFINSASASAPFLRATSGAARIVVTATKTGSEVSAPRFGLAFAQAVGDTRADLDRDGGVSVLEAFVHASKRVEAMYAEEGLLSSEHALIEDNGDGFGTPASFFKGLSATPAEDAQSASRDGARARQVSLIPAPPEQALPPALRRRRDELESAVLALREQRARETQATARPGGRAAARRMSDAAYYARLERLLLEIARLYQQVERGTDTTSKRATGADIETAAPARPSGP